MEPKQSSQHWSADRLHADANRAVGGAFNLLREVCRIGSLIDDSMAVDAIIRRAQFLAYELQTELHHLGATTETDPAVSLLDERGRLQLLNRFLFTEKKFRCLGTVPPFSNLGNDSPESLRMNRVLIDRTGAPIMIELLYAFLAERLGVNLEFADLKPTCFLKWRNGQQSHYIDVTREGAILTSDELIETLHTRFHLTNLCSASALEVQPFESFIADYIFEIKSCMDEDLDTEALLRLQEALIAYMPSNLKLIAERAVLHSRVGNFKNALLDLKRYFSFHDRSRAPQELVDLFDDLTDRAAALNGPSQV